MATAAFVQAQKPDGTPNAYAVDIIDRRWAWGQEAETNGFWDALGSLAKAEGLFWGGRLAQVQGCRSRPVPSKPHAR